MAKRKNPHRIIDAHNHPDWHGHDFDATIANMDKYGIAKAWLLSWEVPPADCEQEYNDVVPSSLFGAATGPIPFARCLSYKERAPGRFILGYAPDARRPEAVDLMKAAIDIYGVRICGEFKQRIMLDNPDALRLFRLCGERGVPVVVHIDYEFETGLRYPRASYWYGGGMLSFERAVGLCPQTVFLGHAPGFWAHISADRQYEKVAYPDGKVKPGGKLTKMLRKYPNLYCDISASSGLKALKRDAAFTKDFFAEFQDRILYGRDDFGNEHQEFLNALGLPKKVLDKIYFRNALALVPEI
ncbi:MAG: amidohydrolase family protein [Planctomycetes bacterium]|nr:amidohydrolase family protein [Planctomycetota bacterium]